MTATYFVQRKADDLRIGNMFVDWAFPTDGVYGSPSRIMDIRRIDLVTKEMVVKLADKRKFRFMPEMQVIVQELA